MNEETKSSEDNPTREGLRILARWIARDIYNKKVNKIKENCNEGPEPEKEKS